MLSSVPLPHCYIDGRGMLMSVRGWLLKIYHTCRGSPYSWRNGPPYRGCPCSFDYGLPYRWSSYSWENSRPYKGSHPRSPFYRGSPFSHDTGPLRDPKPFATHKVFAAASIAFVAKEAIVFGDVAESPQVHWYH